MISVIDFKEYKYSNSNSYIIHEYYFKTRKRYLFQYSRYLTNFNDKLFSMYVVI